MWFVVVSVCLWVFERPIQAALLRLSRQWFRTYLPNRAQYITLANNPNCATWKRAAYEERLFMHLRHAPIPHVHLSAIDIPYRHDILALYTFRHRLSYAALRMRYGCRSILRSVPLWHFARSKKWSGTEAKHCLMSIISDSSWSASRLSSLSDSSFRRFLHSPSHFLVCRR